MTRTIAGTITRRTFLSAVTASGVALLAACGGGSTATTTGSNATASSGSATGAGSASVASTSAATALATSSTPASAAAIGTTSSASTAVSAAPVAPSAVKGSIQFLNIGGQSATYSDFTKTVIPSFTTAYPGVQVQMLTSDWGPSFQKISTAIAGGTAPDVFVMGGIWTGPLASKGAMLALDSYVAKWSSKSDIPDNVWADSMYQGKTYAVPAQLDTRTVVYRKDQYDAASLQPPSTWDELKADAAKLAQKQGSTVSREGMDLSIDSSVGAQQTFINLLYQAGGNYFSADGKTATFETDAGRAALTYMVGLIKDGSSSTAFQNPPNGPGFLTLGSTAPAFGGITGIANAKQYAPAEAKNIALSMPLRMDANHPPKTLIFINKLGIYQGTKAPDAAWGFLSTVMEPANLTLWLTTVGNLPSRTSVSQNAPFVKDDPNAQILQKTIQYARPQAQSRIMFDAVQILNKAVLNALYLRATVDDTLKTIDAQLNQSLNS